MNGYVLSYPTDPTPSAMPWSGDTSDATVKAIEQLLEYDPPGMAEMSNNPGLDR